MNNQGQEKGLLGIFIAFISCILLLIIFSVAKQALAPCPTCQICDCSPYQTNLSECLSTNTNLSTIIQERPIEYIQNITYVPEYKSLPKTEIIYSYIFIGLSAFLVIFFSFKFHLFKIDHLLKIEVKDLPEGFKQELEKFKEELSKFTNSVKWAKRIVIAFAVLLLIKLIILIFST